MTVHRRSVYEGGDRHDRSRTVWVAAPRVPGPFQFAIAMTSGAERYPWRSPRIDVVPTSALELWCRPDGQPDLAPCAETVVSADKPGIAVAVVWGSSHKFTNGARVVVDDTPRPLRAWSNLKGDVWTADIREIIRRPSAGEYPVHVEYRGAVLDTVVRVAAPVAPAAP